MPGDSSSISLRSSGNARLHSRARNAYRLVIKSENRLTFRTAGGLKLSIGALFCCLFEFQEATSKANGHGVGSVICLELFDDVPDMEIDRRFGNP